MKRIELLVGNGRRRTRLEDYLCGEFSLLSKMYIREVVKGGGCEVNGRHENIGYRLRVNDFIEIELDLTREHSMLPQEISIDVVHEDGDLVVVNKPAGMLVHPSHREKNGTLLNALAYHFNKAAEAPIIRPGLVHRLDKGTSGLIVVAKNPRAHRILCRHFQKKLVGKKYVAKVLGNVISDEGVINGDIGRDADLKYWVLKAGGKASESLYKVLSRNGATTLIELEPITGRTNQLRIHCASIGHPIVGDKERGGGAEDRLYLHAARLSFIHPTTGEIIDLTSSPEWDSD